MYNHAHAQKSDSMMTFVFMLVVVMVAIATVAYFGIHEIIPALAHIKASTVQPSNT